MDYLKMIFLTALSVLLLICITTEAYPEPPAQRRQYQVNDAEAAASDWEHDHGHRPRHHHHDGGVTGPIHTFVKTDKHANYKWGVRHHVGNKYS